MNIKENSSLFQYELIHGENILWTGKPDPWKLFTLADIFLIPFSFLFMKIALTGEYALFSALPENIFSLIYSVTINTLFVLLGFYYTLGRYIYKFLLRKNTIYAVTNKRILIKSTFFPKKLQVKFIKDAEVVNIKVRNNKSGDIVFGKNDFGTTMNNNAGLDLFFMFIKEPSIPAFYNIENVKAIHNLITDTRDGKHLKSN